MVLISLMTLNLIHTKKTISLDEFLSGIIKSVYPHRLKYAIFFLFIIFIMEALHYRGIMNIDYVIIYILVFCTLQFLTYFFMTVDEEGEIALSSISYAFVAMITILYSIYLLARYDYENLFNIKQSVTIKLNDTKIECNDKTHNSYLGKTDNYLFVKLYQSNSRLVIPISEVKSLEFISND